MEDVLIKTTKFLAELDGCYQDLELLYGQGNVSIVTSHESRLTRLLREKDYSIVISPDCDRDKWYVVEDAYLLKNKIRTA
jgi:hypothetical protein